jgi:hypothetical protein
MPISLTKDQQTKAIEMREAGALYPAMAAELGASESVIRRFLHSIGMTGRVPGSNANGTYKIGGKPEDREILKLRNEVSRLQGELKTAHTTTLDDAEMRRLLKVLADREANPPTWLAKAKTTRNQSEVPVALWSDWHSGEVVNREEMNGANEFNVDILKKRVRKLVERTLRLADKQGSTYPGVVINLLGDFVSGGLHPELSKTDEIEVMSAVFVVVDLLIWALTAMADRFGRVYLACTDGNHGRNTKKPEFKNYRMKNFDWMIYKILEKHFQKDKRFVFDIPASNEVLYRVYGKRFLAMHGDMLGARGGDGIIGAIGPIMRGEIKVRGSMVSMISDYDFLLIGHWHQTLWLPRVMCNNALKGYDEYAKNALRAPFSRPAQSLFFVHPTHGITARWEIYLEDAISEAEHEWVSVRRLIDPKGEM